MAVLGYLVVSAEFHQEGNKVVAFCPQLGIATFGQNLPEAESRLQEAIALQLETLDYLGQLNNFFEYHNITVCVDCPEGASQLIQTTPDSWVKVIAQALRLYPEAGNRAPHPLAPSPPEGRGKRSPTSP